MTARGDRRPDLFGVAVFPTGDRNGRDVTAFQPIKLAAMEGLFKTEREAPLAIIGMPDTATNELIDPIFVPDFLSFLTRKLQG